MKKKIKLSKISVIIPCYNDGRYLPEALASVEKCDKDSYEIIIVDDGSSDKKTAEILELMKKRGHRVFRVKHKGQSAARNFGVKKARYNYLLFLDSDNKIIPEYITKGAKILDNNPDVGVVFADRQQFGLAKDVVPQNFEISEAVFGNTIDTCALVRKEAWKQCSGFDENLSLSEDWEFYISIYEKGWKFFHIPKILFYYRIRKNSVHSKIKNKKDRVRAVEYILRKHKKTFINGLADMAAGILIGEKNKEITRLKRIEAGLEKEISHKDSMIGKSELEIRRISGELEGFKKSMSWKFSQKLEQIALRLLKSPKLMRIYRTLILRGQNFFDNKDNKKQKSFKSKYNFELRTNYKKLIFKKSKNPEVSVIIPAFNKWKFTYNCLRSLLENEKLADYEVIVADDCSSDETKNVSNLIENIKISRNEKNLGFLDNCNRAADRATGKYLLFLNNDTYVLDNSISHLLAAAKSSENIGAVGGKIISFDGTLQEAGSVVWRDGTTKGYGRGDDPDNPEYNFLREVDYSSGAFLLVKKELFLKLGKFNTMYRPGYYEEADFCMRLRKNGYKVIYQPFAQVVHYETVSMEDKVSALQIKNSALFSRIWKKEILSRYPFGQSFLARFSGKSRNQKKLLYIDNETPDPRLGSGYPRTYAIMNYLLKLGYNITFYPAVFSGRKNETVEYFQKRGVEMFYDTDSRKLDFEEFLKERKNYYEIICVSRPDNMARFGDIIRKYSGASSLIYDAEAIFAVREMAYLKTIGEKISEAKKDEMLKNEISLCKNVDRIISVSEREKTIFAKYGVKNSFVISHQSPLRLTPKKFEERNGLFFAGGILFDGPKNPNLDSILYFVKEVFPLVRKKINCEFLIAGKDESGKLKNLRIKGVRWLGCVDNLSEYYNNSRIFIVPTRFCAGIPLKAVEAASYGLPMVTSEIVAEQLNWKDGKECLVGGNPRDFAEKIIRLYSDAELWNKIKNNAADKIRAEYSQKVFEESVRKVFFI